MRLCFILKVPKHNAYCEPRSVSDRKRCINENTSVLFMKAISLTPIHIDTGKQQQSMLSMAGFMRNYKKNSCEQKQDI